MQTYLSVSQYAKKKNKDVGNIRKLLIEGRLRGIKIGNQWAIDSNEPYQEDKRIVSGRYVNFRKKLNLYKNKELINCLKSMINELKISLGDNIVSVVLYGSYARGEETAESDVDIAVFLNKTSSEVRDSIIECAAKYELEVGKVLSVIDIDINNYEKWKETMPFYKNINKEGICLWRREK